MHNWLKLDKNTKEHNGLSIPFANDTNILIKNHPYKNMFNMMNEE